MSTPPFEVLMTNADTDCIKVHSGLPMSLLGFLTEPKLQVTYSGVGTSPLTIHT